MRRWKSAQRREELVDGQVEFGQYFGERDPIRALERRQGLIRAKDHNRLVFDVNQQSDIDSISHMPGALAGQNRYALIGGSYLDGNVRRDELTIRNVACPSRCSRARRYTLTSGTTAAPAKVARSSGKGSTEPSVPLAASTSVTMSFVCSRLCFTLGDTFPVMSPVQEFERRLLLWQLEKFGKAYGRGGSDH